MFFLLPSLAPFLWARAASWRVLHVENSLEHTSWYCINNQLSIILTQRLTMSSLIGKEEWMHVSVVVTISVISLLPLWLSLHYSLTDQASSPPMFLSHGPSSSLTSSSSSSLSSWLSARHIPLSFLLLCSLCVRSLQKTPKRAGENRANRKGGGDGGRKGWRGKEIRLIGTPAFEILSH